jgi:hypothetical protein
MIREKEIDLSPKLSRPIFVRLSLPAGEALSVPPLSATLGQIQVNAVDFCKQFNLFTSTRYELGTLLNVKLYKNPNGTYFFIVVGISKSFLFFQACDEDKFIPVEVAFDIFRIVYKVDKRPVNQFRLAKEFFGSLRSMGFKIIILNPIDKVC